MRLSNLVKLLLPVLVCLSLSTPAIAQSSGDSEKYPWLSLINKQMAAEKMCDVGFYVYFREGKLGGRTTFEARVQCVDGRQFDAIKVEPAITFEIKECAVTVC
ncbi:MAG: hypothetical protein JKX93_01950 [Rhizobiaceae bacterium]|nr:hypothetical protein [Rhizobiaceae bacterium]